MLLSGLVPDLVLSMRRTEAVHRAVGLGGIGGRGWGGESETAECTTAPPDTEAAGGSVPQTR